MEPWVFPGRLWLSESKPTRLHFAAVTEDTADITALLAEGLDVNAEAPLMRKGASVIRHGYTPLHLAAGWNTDLNVINVLGIAGASVNARAGGSLTPLHLAAELNSEPMAVQLLLDLGADIEAKSRAGLTVLHLATVNPNPAVAALLVDMGADLDAEDSQGRTPCQFARKFADSEALTEIEAIVCP